MNCSRVDFGLALLRSVSVNLAELRRAPATGGREGEFELSVADFA